MAKEWILNGANMRWGLTKKNKVGPVMELIRKCAPRTKEEWETYYYENVYPKEHLEQLGRTLYIKISEICRAEIDDIEEQDCIDFVVHLVIHRTFDGYQSEIQTIYRQLQNELGVKIFPASDEWDRTYNVDFYIEVNRKYIGLQIKPAAFAYIPQIINELQFQNRTHQQFTERWGGRVFYIISIAEGKKKKIHNIEVIDEIRREIQQLQRQL